MPTPTTFTASIGDVSQQGDQARLTFRRWPNGPVQHHRFPIDDPFGAALLALAMEHPYVRVTIDETSQPPRLIEVVRLAVTELGNDNHHHGFGPGDPNGVKLVREASHTYAEADHTHAGFAATNHAHPGYAATEHLHAGYAATNHAHPEYAATNHAHPGYAATEHLHAGYAATSHAHPEYAARDHAHPNYAPVERVVVSEHAFQISGGRPVQWHVRLADVPGNDPNMPITSEQVRTRRLRIVYAEIQPQTNETAPCSTASAITTTYEAKDNAHVWMAGVSVALMRHPPGSAPVPVTTGNQPQAYTLSLCLAYT